MSLLAGSRRRGCRISRHRRRKLKSVSLAPRPTAFTCASIPLPLTDTCGTLPELLPELPPELLALPDALASIFAGVAAALAMVAEAAAIAIDPFILTA